MPTCKAQSSLGRKRPPFSSFSLPVLHRVLLRFMTTLTLSVWLQARTEAHQSEADRKWQNRS